MRKEGLKRDNLNDAANAAKLNDEDDDDLDNQTNGKKSNRGGSSHDDSLADDNNQSLDPFDELFSSKPDETLEKTAKHRSGTSTPAEESLNADENLGETSDAANGDADKSENENDDGYEVDEIVDHKYKGKYKKLYKIRWQGYGADADTWEPEDSLSCPALIEKYLELHPDERAPKKAKKEKTEKKAKKVKTAAEVIPRDVDKRSTASKKTIIESDDGAESVDSTQKNKKKPTKSAKGKLKKKDAAEVKYEVDSIIDHRTKKGKKEFRIRWKGYGAKDDTWEEKANLSCPHLIKKYLTAIAEDKTDYEVEKIFGQKVTHGKIYYLVKWKGYSEDDNTWEPEATVNCPELIEEYIHKFMVTPKSVASKRSASSGSVSPSKVKKVKLTPKNTKASKKSYSSDEHEEDPLQSDESEDEKEWEVENIIDDRTIKGKKQYLIRWKGCKSSEDTWEASDQINCPDILEKFLKDKKSPSKATSRATLKSQKKSANEQKINAGARKSTRRA